MHGKKHGYINVKLVICFFAFLLLISIAFFTCFTLKNKNQDNMVNTNEQEINLKEDNKNQGNYEEIANSNSIENSVNIEDGNIIKNEDNIMSENEVMGLSNEQFLKLLNNMMEKNGYNKYAVRVINSFITDYQELFNNYEIYKLFHSVSCITINPYDPDNPNLSEYNRAYNAGGDITVNCFENELENDSNWDGLRWLLTHEIMHSLGDFPYTCSEISNSEVSVAIRNMLLEEGLADSIAHFVKGTEHNTRFAVIKQEEFIMYEIGENYQVDLNSNINHAYNLSGNVINLFKYIGCYDEIIHANINSDFSALKKAMGEKVVNGEKYFDELFELLNTMYLYIEYPNTFNNQETVILNNELDEHLVNIIKNNNLNELVIQYAKLSAEIINNRIDKTYDISEFKENNLILYSEDGINFKTDLK